MSRRSLVAAATTILALLLQAPPVRAAEPIPPAPGLTLRLADRGNGGAQYEWLDAEGRVYDLGPERWINEPAAPVPGVPIPVVYGDVEGMIAAAAGRYGLDAGRMKRIAWCESKYQPGATSRGGHRGVFQFDGPTWRGRAGRAGVSTDFDAAYDARANVEVAAATMAMGEWGRWACK